MGRRKSKRKPPPKNRATEPLDTLFNCPFCNHEKSCEVKMEKTKNTGNIKCMVCMEDFQAGSFSRSPVIFPIHILSNHYSDPTVTNVSANCSLSQATINFLSEPIDVYNEWIDACEEANT